MIFITGGEGAGQAEYAEKNAPGAAILGNYHLTVREQLAAGEDPLQKAALLLQEHEASGRNLVIWTCEIGCGLVPLSREARAWRDAAGRVNCFLAEKADLAVRMICGRAEILKEASGIAASTAESSEISVIAETIGKSTEISGTAESAGDSTEISRLAENVGESSEMHNEKRISERNSPTKVKEQAHIVEKSSDSTNACGKTGSRAESRSARPLMVVGTMSNAGKSFIAAGLCRIFTDDGYSVAPFKAQNMALNSFITKKGEEMGRSQVVQAEACRKEPDARMNPILLKPTTDKGSQIIINGHPVADMDAKEYYRHKNEYLPYVREAYDSLAAENDIIVLEGAGSPAEINLKENDIVNMPMAAMVNAPVILVGNIDPGGVFAQLYGTLKLLEPAEQDLIAGMIINKFRGDLSILEPGIGMLEEKTGKKVLGVLPYSDIRLEPEDSLAMEEWERKEKERCRLQDHAEDGGSDGKEENKDAASDGSERNDEDAAGTGSAEGPAGKTSGKQKPLDIAVIRLPKISNFTDLEALALEPDVRLRYVKDARELGTPDVIILPGTKSTIADLLWLRQTGLETMIRRAHAGGTFLVGICGGYQMLGTVIRDPDGAEAKGETAGLGYLDMSTVFSPEKIMRQTETVSCFGIPEIDGKKITGYEVHMGRAEEELLPKAGAAQNPERKPASPVTGAQVPGEGGSMGSSEDRNVIGTYIHGIFDEEDFRDAFLAFIYARKGQQRSSVPEKRQTYREFREQQLCDLAEMLRKHLDIPAIYRILGIQKENGPQGTVCEPQRNANVRTAVNGAEGNRETC